MGLTELHRCSSRALRLTSASSRIRRHVTCVPFCQEPSRKRVFRGQPVTLAVMPNLARPTVLVRDSFVEAARRFRDEGWLPGFPVEEVAASLMAPFYDGGLSRGSGPALLSVRRRWSASTSFVLALARCGRCTLTPPARRREVAAVPGRRVAWAAGGGGSVAGAGPGSGWSEVPVPGERPAA